MIKLYQLKVFSFHLQSNTFQTHPLFIFIQKTKLLIKKAKLQNHENNRNQKENTTKPIHLYKTYTKKQNYLKMNPYQKKYQNNKPFQPQQTYTRQKPSAYTNEKYCTNGINQKSPGAGIDRAPVNINERAWMGQLSDKKIIESKIESSQHYQTQSPSNKQRQQFTTMQFASNNDSPTSRVTNTMSRKSNTQKQQTPTQLMNDIFRSIGFNHLSTTKTFYSKQSQDFLTEILSNKAKMASYLRKLSLQMSEVSPEVEKNYEILMILLQQVGEADLEIHQDENGMRILFNRNELVEKQKEVERLERELDEKNKQTEKIVQQYETVIRNFNDVIQKLIQQKKY